MLCICLVWHTYAFISHAWGDRAGGGVERKGAVLSRGGVEGEREEGGFPHPF